ncbi:hemolysin family protein [Microcella alkaliphila]|uniref:Conserved membrane protein, transporter family 9.A.40 n=1 Tax=Microcella alkaliphila TaxID=279828 RepID=A0A0U5BIM9_9MICO|nr:hemolysin family protein [Microcella alkaliphila]BAU32958.1 conserved membrane protein, transporter family 9.A.40 [Microcella alkaliphila]
MITSADWWGLVWLVVLLAGNAFFVGAEFAVISAKRSQIEPRAEAGSRAAKTALWAMERATLMLATSQLGITVCSLLILNVSEPAIHHILEIPISLTGLPPEVVSTIAFIIALLIVSFLHVVLGEMVPKNLSFSLPTRAVLILAPPLVTVARIFAPVIWSLNAIANGILRLCGVEPKDEATSTYTLDEVATIVKQSTREGLLTDATGTLGVPMDALVTLPEDASALDVERGVAQRGFSRYPLVDEAGEPTGYLHLKDIIDLPEDEFDDPVPPKRIRRLVSILASAELEDALALMRRSGSHLARSVDAEGQTVGVLFLEDILEELVGEVQDATRRRHFG